MNYKLKTRQPKTTHSPPFLGRGFWRGRSTPYAENFVPLTAGKDLDKDQLQSKCQLLIATPATSGVGLRFKKPGRNAICKGTGGVGHKKPGPRRCTQAFRQASKECHKSIRISFMKFIPAAHHQPADSHGEEPKQGGRGWFWARKSFGGLMSKSFLATPSRHQQKAFSAKRFQLKA